jgi:hypothetical protein
VKKGLILEEEAENTVSQAYFALRKTLPQSSKFSGKKSFLVLRLPLRHFKAFPKI